MELLDQLRGFGQKTLGRPDAKAVLRHLFTVQKKSAQEIATLFGVTGEAVRYHLRAMGLMPHRPSFEEILVAKGYATRTQFFNEWLAKRRRSWVEMAKFLGLTPNAVKYQHNLYLRDKMLRAAGQ